MSLQGPLLPSLAEGLPMPLRILIDSLHNTALMLERLSDLVEHAKKRREFRIQVLSIADNNITSSQVIAEGFIMDTPGFLGGIHDCYSVLLGLDDIIDEKVQPAARTAEDRDVLWGGNFTRKNNEAKLLSPQTPLWWIRKLRRRAEMLAMKTLKLEKSWYKNIQIS